MPEERIFIGSERNSWYAKRFFGYDRLKPAGPLPYQPGIKPVDIRINVEGIESTVKAINKIAEAMQDIGKAFGESRCQIAALNVATALAQDEALDNKIRYHNTKGNTRMVKRLCLKQWRLSRKLAAYEQRIEDMGMANPVESHNEIHKSHFKPL